MITSGPEVVMAYNAHLATAQPLYSVDGKENIANIQSELFQLVTRNLDSFHIHVSKKQSLHVEAEVVAPTFSFRGNYSG